MNPVMENEYTTKDFYLAACLLASGFYLSRLEQSGYRTFSFIFSVSPIQAKAVIANHWNRKLNLPSRDLIEAINELKTRIYAEK